MQFSADVTRLRRGGMALWLALRVARARVLFADPDGAGSEEGRWVTVHGHAVLLGARALEHAAGRMAEGLSHDEAHAEAMRVHGVLSVAGEEEAGAPSVRWKSPNDRHKLRKVRAKSHHRRLNTVAESWVKMGEDVAAINRGEATREGEHYRVNGRLYGLHRDRAFPIEGPGLHPLGEKAYIALGVYNESGISDEASARMDAEGISEADRESARRVYETERGRD